MLNTMVCNCLPSPQSCCGKGWGGTQHYLLKDQLQMPFALYLGRIFPDISTSFASCLRSEVKLLNHLKSCQESDLGENCIRIKLGKDAVLTCGSET